MTDATPIPIDLRSLATALVAELVRSQAGGEAPPLDAEAARREVQRILTEHADAIAGLTVGAAFDLLSARSGASTDLAAFAQLVHAMSDAALIAEIEATSDTIGAAVEHMQARIALAQELAQAALIVLRALLGAVIASGTGGVVRPA